MSKDKPAGSDRFQSFEMFMAEFRGVPAPIIWKALNTLTSGVNWNKCTKKHLAESWADGYHFQGITMEDVRTAVQIAQQPSEWERQEMMHKAAPDLAKALQIARAYVANMEGSEAELAIVDAALAKAGVK
jgi:beta-xylosidase